MKISTLKGLNFSLALLFALSIGAQTTYTTIQAGIWSNPAVWDGGNIPPEPIPAGDVVNINHSITTFSTPLITNNGSIETLTTSAFLTLQGTTQLVNNGEINLINQSSYASFAINSGTSAVNNGTITAGNAVNFSAMRLLGGDFTNSSGALLDLENALFTIENGNSLLTNQAGGDIDIGVNSQFNVFFFDTPNVLISNAGTIDVNGLWSLGSVNPIIGAGGNYTNLATGVINIAGRVRLTKTMTNAGIINILPDDPDIIGIPAIEVSSGGMINSLSGTVNHNNGLISGQGTIVQPDFSCNSTFNIRPSTFSIDSDFDIEGNFDGTGLLSLVINGSTADEYGQLDVTGAVDLTQLTLRIVSNFYNEQLGDVFTIITADGGVSGPFANTILPFLGSGLEWEVEYNPTDVVLRVVPEASDSDNDGVADNDDNCPDTPNADQEDTNNDGIGDACENACASVGGLPCGYSQQLVGCDGGTTYDAATGTFEVTSDGCDIRQRGRRDELSLVTTELCGNGSIMARVEDVQGQGRAGVFMRETLNANSKVMQAQYDKGVNQTGPQYNLHRHWRTSTGGGLYYGSSPAFDDYWVLITRAGNTFRVYRSDNGSSWAQVAQKTISMASCIQVGLVVNSRSNDQPVVAQFSNVSVTGNSPAAENTSSLADIVSTPYNAADFSITDDSEPRLAVYPNPTSGQLTVQIDQAWTGPAQLELRDGLGRVVTRQSLSIATTGQATLDLSAQPAGVYYLQLTGPEGERLIRKVVRTDRR